MYTVSRIETRKIHLILPLIFLLLLDKLWCISCFPGKPVPGFENTILPSSSDGIRLTIDKPSENPDPDQRGIEITPGHSTLISIAGKEILRKPWPYGTCTNTDHELKLLRGSVSMLYSDRDVNFDEDEQASYSRQQCRSACLQRLIWQECKCLDLKSRLPFADVEGKLICGTLGETDMDMLMNDDKYTGQRCAKDMCPILHKMINDLACVKRVTDTFNKKKLSGETDCMCPEACYSYEYVMTVSATITNPPD